MTARTHSISSEVTSKTAPPPQPPSLPPGEITSGEKEPTDNRSEPVNGSLYPIMFPPPPHGYYPPTNQHQAFGPDGQPIPRYLTTCYPFVQESYIYMPHYRQVSHHRNKLVLHLPRGVYHYYDGSLFNFIRRFEQRDKKSLIVCNVASYT